MNSNADCDELLQKVVIYVRAVIAEADAHDPEVQQRVADSHNADKKHAL